MPGVTRGDAAGVGWLVVASLIIGAAAGLSTVPRANADPATDAAFLAALDEEGITYPSRAVAIGNAHTVCDWFDQGASLVDAVHEVRAQSQLDGGHAAYFVGASIAAYCPRYLGLTKPATQRHPPTTPVILR